MGMAVRLTPWGVQCGRFLVERCKPLKISATDAFYVIEQLKHVYEQTGTSLCELFDQYYTAADGKVAQTQDIPTDVWPDIIGDV